MTAHFSHTCCDAKTPSSFKRPQFVVRLHVPQAANGFSFVRVKKNADLSPRDNFNIGAYCLGSSVVYEGTYRSGKGGEEPAM